jgi:hypothetical protein
MPLNLSTPIVAGNYREFGGSLATSKAALLDSTRSTVANTNEGQNGASLAASVGYGSQAIQAKALTVKRIDPDLPHVVPLSDGALSVLHGVKGISDNVIFPASRSEFLSDMSMLAILKRMNWIDRTTVHDFVSEMALAHSVGDSMKYIHYAESKLQFYMFHFLFRYFCKGFSKKRNNSAEHIIRSNKKK